MASYKIKSRYHVNLQFNFSNTVQVPETVHHHLLKVIKAQINNNITLFNTNGEWLYTITQISKTKIIAQKQQLIQSYIAPLVTLGLFYAPLKQESTSFLLEKTTELGISTLCNVITQHTVNKPLNPSKITAKIVNATQQCKRLDIPNVLPAVLLTNFINNHNNILWLNEDLTGENLANLQIIPNQNYNIIIGPEGGFSPAEKQLLSNSPNVTKVYLKTNVLKAETAAVAAVVTLQNLIGNLA